MIRLPLFNRSGSARAADPVCDMQVDIRKRKPPGGTQQDHDGETYYFCAPGCRIAFSKGAGGVPVGGEEDTDVSGNGQWYLPEFHQRFCRAPVWSVGGQPYC